MGADQFESIAFGKTMAEAFDRAREEALWDHGHSGYTGTIAEKPGAVLYPEPHTHAEVDELINHWNQRWDHVLDDHDKHNKWAEIYDDKWGPCVAIEITGPIPHWAGKPGKGEKTFLFTGYASS